MILISFFAILFIVAVVCYIFAVKKQVKKEIPRLRDQDEDWQRIKNSIYSASDGQAIQNCYSAIRSFSYRYQNLSGELQTRHLMNLCSYRQTILNPITPNDNTR